MGQPDCLKDSHPYIFYGSKRRELKHLSTCKGKENNLMIPLVVASERGRAQTCDVAMRRRGCRTTLSYFDCEANILESIIIEGDNPVSEA